ncbi:MAG TPA: 23S rRNA (guanosine(2251)-2'-O)-methyltransferase RlmB [Desulfomonilia bacterium]|nr:23S rRNA (guanosine(2251)-2'-O)-methyltransferase RlmB [Desulfomonilia bacterium]
MKNNPRNLRHGRDRRAATKASGGFEVIYGRNAVLESLRAGKREFSEILVLPQHYDDLLEESGGVPVRIVQKPDMDRITSTINHQGIAARASVYRYADLKGLYPLPCIVLLDSVEDPQNLGSIIRTAHALADAGIIIPEHRSAPVSPAVLKASSGAAEYVKIARVKNLRTAAQDLKKIGFWIVGLEAGASKDISSAPVFEKIGIVLGGEDSGIRPVMASELDLLVGIPMKGSFNSLNVAQAAAIALYELVARVKKK